MACGEYTVSRGFDEQILSISMAPFVGVCAVKSMMFDCWKYSLPLRLDVCVCTDARVMVLLALSCEKLWLKLAFMWTFATLLFAFVGVTSSSTILSVGRGVNIVRRRFGVFRCASLAGVSPSIDNWDVCLVTVCMISSSDVVLSVCWRRRCCINIELRRVTRRVVGGVSACCLLAAFGDLFGIIVARLEDEKGWAFSSFLLLLSLPIFLRISDAVEKLLSLEEISDTELIRVNFSRSRFSEAAVALGAGEFRIL